MDIKLSVYAFIHSMYIILVTLEVVADIIKKCGTLNRGSFTGVMEGWIQGVIQGEKMMEVYPHL